ncbi:putative peptide modification system cyclase [Pseudomarimonas salicorniae]|uniref:Peptide modification system cyclase n=1 Tax=Pseudomarimonas salicorniae TaxID=2933270 RepID=A0ABT0GG73_9GAMM|nr:putative peptide modification system cyclase [Lysobacter sp. CAU 1642]MCK7593204.1 putative peptide modification system cyclase [Lysobacter sp. CAU 1642]
MLSLLAEATRAAHSVRCALLVTDLVDSTELFARLGEYEATQLLSTEEEGARRLARYHGGQEIDRSDGFLFVFEQPWQAVAFALDYQRELDGLSRRSGVALKSKVGIHWAEVYLTRHEPEDVARGAKPVEVSGVGKPIAARLMSAAHGGQILISTAAREVAEAACAEHRAEIGDLDWIAHGRFRLKGVDLPIEVHEVLVRGAVRPREPLENSKVVSLRRESRRRLLRGGAALAASVALPAGGVAWYRYTRFEFPKTGWLVLADWMDSVGDASLAQVLGTAFRIALEQSRFAYVLNGEAVRETLRRMRSDVEQLTDRSLAIEVAQREQAKALVMPAVSSIDIGLRLSCTVIDPWKNRLVHSVDVAMPSAESLTRALDDLAAAVRTSLGESIEAIVADSRPLAKVTTTDLTALRLYSEAELKVRDRKPLEAAALLQQAIDIDPDFASALAKLGTVQMLFRIDQRRAESNWRAAIERSDRLTRREQMYVEAALSNTTTPELMRARWTAMYAAFPDDMAAGNNVAWLAWSHYGQPGDALAVQRQVVKLSHPWRSRALHNLGYMQLALGEMDAAATSLQEALELEGNPIHWGLLRLFLVRGDSAAAAELIERFAQDAQTPSLETERVEAAVLHAVHRGDLEAARRLGAALERRSTEWDFPAAGLVAHRAELHAAIASGDQAPARRAFSLLLDLLREQIEADVGGAMLVPRADALMLALVSAREVWPEQGAAVAPLATLDGRWRAYPLLQALQRLSEGWQAQRAGRHDEAVLAAEESRLRAPLFLSHELELEARLSRGEAIGDRAATLSRRLHEGLGESYNYFSLQLPNLMFWRRLRGWV